ncbi:DNA polymerase III subunit delta' [Hydromonas duriensis]|uniref:DNA polymerase III delta prime subunit n=1 Tax=Hydromonas duriensis TaxID=1527608 RepID=A0A4V3DJY1_9BURK|nr:DNA polymerase III subunit delta' [Hydromonas duriensis]TDR31880.1 DNA polymerase III delta prime subunit [Hydromonas duriensis]
MTTLLLPWHTTFFEQWHAQSQRSHAYLLIAPEDTGGEAFLHQLAASVLCEKPNADHAPCGSCSGCQLLAAYSHPDLRVLRPSILDANHPVEELRPEKPSKHITIDDVRELANMVNQTSHRGGTRVVLIYPAHKLNLNAANALLKTLEEPPANTLFFLLAHDAKQLLPTIISRCQRVHLSRPSTAQAIAYLNQHCGDNPNWLNDLTQENGAVLRVAQLHSTNYFTLQTQFIHALAQGKDMDALKLAEQFDKHIKDADKAYLSGEARTLDMGVTLMWLQRWLHDGLLTAQGVGTPRYYAQHAKALTSLFKNMPTSLVQRAHAMQNMLLKEQRTSEHPLNIKIWLEKLLLQYTQLF